MALVILMIIAAWYLPLPLALQICITVFGSLHCLFSLIRLVVKLLKKSDEEQANDLLRKYLPRH